MKTWSTHNRAQRYSGLAVHPVTVSGAERWTTHGELIGEVIKQWREPEQVDTIRAVSLVKLRSGMIGVSINSINAATGNYISYMGHDHHKPMACEVFGTEDEAERAAQRFIHGAVLVSQ